jgi:tRNA G18 (ribose-2'-O)-methylase SpoU
MNHRRRVLIMMLLQLHNALFSPKNVYLKTWAYSTTRLDSSTKMGNIQKVLPRSLSLCPYHRTTFPLDQQRDRMIQCRMDDRNHNTSRRNASSSSGDSSSSDKRGIYSKIEKGRDIIYNQRNMKNVISSTQSLTAKKIHALLHYRKKRVEYNLVVVEGPRLILDLYRNIQTRRFIQQILIDIEVYEQYAKHFMKIHEQYPEDTSNPSRQIMFHPTYKDVFKKCCTSTVTNQGIVAICDIPHPITSFRFRNQNDARSTEGSEEDESSEQQEQEQRQAHRMYLVCDAIQDPGNMGTLIRSAVASGVSAIYTLPNACDVWNPKAIRAAMGATFAIPIIETDHWEDCYRQLLVVGCTPSSIYAATMMDDYNEDEKFSMEKLNDKSRNDPKKANTSDASSTAYYDIDWMGQLTKPHEEAEPVLVSASALIIGSEGNGLTIPLRDAIQNKELQTAYVPMMNHDSMAATSVVESLNAAVCGSIILFDYFRQKEQRLAKQCK